MNACSFGPAPWWLPPLHIAVTTLALLGGLTVLTAAAIAASPGLRDLAWDFMYRDTPQSPMCPPVRWDGAQWIPDGRQVTAREWFRLPKHERDRRAAEFRSADDALRLNSEAEELAEELAGVMEETESFHVLNGRVNDLWGTVPWWCRR
jgi:hypothetical protein